MGRFRKRTHELLAANPHYLHSNLKVPTGVDEDSGLCLFQRVVCSRIALDPDAFCALDRTPAGARALMNFITTPVRMMSTIVSTSAMQGNLSNITAFLRAGAPANIVSSEVFPMVLNACAEHAAGHDEHYRVQLEMLRELRRAQGDDRGIAVDIGDAGDYPALDFIQQVARKSAISSVVPITEFPGRVLTKGLAALNGVLAPECQYPLESLTGSDFLAHATIGAHNSAGEDYWNEFDASATRGLGVPERGYDSPMDIVDWAVDQPHGPGAGAVMTAADLDVVDGSSAMLSSIVGSNVLAQLRARLVQREMRAAVSGALARTSEPEPSEPRPRVRRRHGA
jgi:hypothetical protein